MVLVLSWNEINTRKVCAFCDGDIGLNMNLQRLLLVLLMTVGPVMADNAADAEYRLKAAYLFNFARFAQWPPATFTATNSPLVIGVLGNNPFGAALEEVVRGRFVNGRPVVVKPVATAEEAKFCQVVFIPASEQANVRRHLETLRTAPVLTIGESVEFLDAGGVIRFFVEQNKIRFDINKAQADAEGLQMDSQLLSLAATVREADGKKGG